MPQKPPLQDPPQPLQAMQLPPFVDAHDAFFANAHRHPAAVLLAREAGDGVLVARAARGEFDAVVDVAEVGA